MIDYTESPLGLIVGVAWGPDGPTGPPPVVSKGSIVSAVTGQWFTGSPPEDEDTLGVGSIGWPVDVSAATNADPVRITTTSGHDLADDMWVVFDDVDGMTELNRPAGPFKIQVVNSTTFDLIETDGTAFGTYTGNGETQPGNLANTKDAWATVKVEGVTSGGVYEWHNMPVDDLALNEEWRALDGNGDPTSDEFYVRFTFFSPVILRIRRPAGSIMDDTFPYQEKARTWSAHEG